MLADSGLVLCGARPYKAPPETAISAARVGYLPALRDPQRTERISLGVLNEVFVERNDCSLQYQASSEHKGDMFTKRLDPASFEVVVARANIRCMKPRTA